uniref:Uncharacterized protein n=1 Tax=Glaucocystis incrassata TaxID=1789788 RepID=A0A3G1IVA3_9EUKA|nr:hypothetical protein [Glaucocystis incrassata]ASQ39973.1 hypothetical protein [Glaucocystis incrassata]
MKKILIKKQIKVKITITNSWKENSFKFFQMELDKINFELLKTQYELFLIEKQFKNKTFCKKTRLLFTNNLLEEISDYIYFLLAKKQLLLKEVENLFLFQNGQEVDYGLLEGFFSLQIGNILNNNSQFEVIVRDGWILKIKEFTKN